MKKQAALAGLVGMLIVSGFGQSVVAQRRLQIGGSRSNFGQRRLAPGFTPDPVTVPLTSGGNVDVRSLSLGAGCVGYVTEQPDFILHMTGNSPSLRVRFDVPGARAVTPTDTTLVVNTAGGSWVCNDDTNGANPEVRLPNTGAGQYDIWVGAYQAGTNARGTLSITEL